MFKKTFVCKSTCEKQPTHKRTHGERTSKSLRCFKGTVACIEKESENGKDNCRENEADVEREVFHCVVIDK